MYRVEDATAIQTFLDVDWKIKKAIPLSNSTVNYIMFILYKEEEDHDEKLKISGYSKLNMNDSSI